MSVHYKFKSALEYDTITFDGLHISVKDLKQAIIQQKRIGKSTDFDLQVTNAQTKEIYTDENTLVPKNTSLLIARIPNANQSKQKQWEGYGGDSSPTVKPDDAGPIAKATDLSNIDAPEEDKIKAMMSQSTLEYDPSNYQKIRGSNQMGAVPPTYRCYKCHQTGHWIKDCTFGQGTDAVEIKKSTGIPQSFMVPVEGPSVPGAMMTPNGSFAVPVLDHQAYNFKPVPAPVVQENKPDIPEDLVCSICTDLLTDAVMIPCCGNSFCDECIRFFLLESEDLECPDCHEKDISPATLIPNRFLRKSVANFKNTTGYIKKAVSRPAPKEPPVQKKEMTEDTKSEIEKNEKTVISEADSTEALKNKLSEKVQLEKAEGESQKDGPPGVSPLDSPPAKRIEGNKKDDYSPKHKSLHNSNSQYERERNNEDRAGTPTIDEPGVTSNNYQYNNENPQSAISNIMPITGVQGPPPNVPMPYPPGQQPISTYPPTAGPPPNFGLPPPNNVPYMQPGPYANPPRPIFDPTRPPMSGPPPFNPPFSSRPPHHRDYDRGIRNRTPPGIIDDTLAAFNRILREKDERERRAKQRLQRRTYSRSRSRSRSYSPRSPRRMRSRSPRRRSRSRSFSLSRRYKDPHPSDRRDRDDYDREYRRDDRDFSRDHTSSRRDNRDHDREYRGGAYDNFDDRYRGSKGQWNSHSMGMRGPPEAYYNPPPPEIVQSSYQPPPNRYPPRDFPPYMSKPDALMPPIHSMPPRKYDDVAPPGVEEPPVPGLENSPRPEDKFGKIEPPADVKEEKRFKNHKESEKSHRNDKERDKDKHRSDRDKRDGKKDRDVDRKRRSNRSATPQRKRSHSRDRETPEKRKKKREDSSDKDRSDRDRKRDHSDDDKLRKNKDKKKKREKEKKEKDKKKRDKKEKHREKEKEKKAKEEVKESDVKDATEKTKSSPVPETPTKKFKAKSPEPVDENQSKPGLYDDVIEENLEQEIKENFEEKRKSDTPERSSKYISQKEGVNEVEEGELDKSREYEDSEKDILELHSNDIDLKSELESRNEMLAPLPEKSKWEDDDDNMGELSPSELKGDSKNSKSGTVSSEVLKRAENAIFAKAINAIRPIEIKKISADRAKFYSGEREEEESAKQVVVQSMAEKKTEKKVEASNPPKLSVKDRLGIKVNEPDPVIRIDSVSPFSRRLAERNYGYGERKGEEDRKRDDKHKRDVRSGRDEKEVRRDRDSHRHKEAPRRDEKRNRSRSKTKTRETDKDRKRKSRSRSESEDHKDKKRKKEKKPREKSHKKEEKPKEEKQEIPKTATEKRKPTIDEATFEPDYDLESETEDKKAESSSSDSESSSSSEEERRKKKRKKHRKKKYRKDSSSSSSESDSDSSEEEREKRRRKHKKNKKKRKKSKNK